MKRILTLMLALVMVLSLCVSLGAGSALAENETPEEHEHDWVKATCTEPKTCSICGATEGEPKGHKVEEWKTTVKATCTESGVKQGVCERCGETVEKTTDPKGHKEPDSWKTIKKPTADDKTRIRVKYCERCGEECKREEKTLSNSEFKSWYKDHCKSISYKKLARSPGKYEGRMIKFSGYVLQVLESNSWGRHQTTLRVATKGRWDDVIYVTIYGDLNKRILEDDKITLWGEYNGVYTYTSIFGAAITIPSMTAEYYSIK